MKEHNLNWIKDCLNEVLQSLDWGNVADWISGIGSLVAIIFIYIQIKQSNKHQQENFYYNFKVAIGIRNVIDEEDKGVYSIKPAQEIVFWGTNDGHVAGSFKFVGLCSQDVFDSVNKQHISEKSSDKYEKISELDPLYELGIKKRQFERVEPGGVSEEITIPMESFELNYKQDQTVCFVYMDPLGKLYKNDLLPRD